MASPFENLLQASQFAVQTRMGYDQMIERKNENVAGLMQRRAEQEQQNQQFISEMNQKDKQLGAQERQFNIQVEQAKRIADRQNEMAIRAYDLQKDDQYFRQNVQFPEEQKVRQATIDYNRGMLASQIQGTSLAQRKFDMELEALERERLSKIPVSISGSGDLLDVDTSIMESAPKEGGWFYKTNYPGKLAYGIGEKVSDIFSGTGKYAGKGVLAIGQEAATSAKTQYPVLMAQTQREIEGLEKAVQEATISKKEINPFQYNETILGISNSIAALERQGNLRKDGNYRKLVEKWNRIQNYLNPQQQQQTAQE